MFLILDKPSDWKTGSVYSYGFTCVWNGSSYTQKQTGKSPNCTLKATSTSNLLSSSNTYNVKTNKSNETYGSILSAKTVDQIPDLISAVGVDGNDGYIKKEDVFAMPSSPQEAVKMELERRELKEDKTIPLYDSEGKTVIGDYPIEYSEPIEYTVDDMK